MFRIDRDKYLSKKLETIHTKFPNHQKSSLTLITYSTEIGTYLGEVVSYAPCHIICTRKQTHVQESPIMTLKMWLWKVFIMYWSFLENSKGMFLIAQNGIRNSSPNFKFPLTIPVCFCRHKDKYWPYTVNVSVMTFKSLHQISTSQSQLILTKYNAIILNSTHNF